MQAISCPRTLFCSSRQARASKRRAAGDRAAGVEAQDEGGRAACHVPKSNVFDGSSGGDELAARACRPYQRQIATTTTTNLGRAVHVNPSC
jgi:hypothetical protein